MAHAEDIEENGEVTEEETGIPSQDMTDPRFQVAGSRDIGEAQEAAKAQSNVNK